MNPCPNRGTLQDFLEALLPEAEMRRVGAHVDGCANCRAERARFERLFEAFAALPLEAPSPALAGRVLDHVLPSRRRTRWVRRVGVGYAAALVASLGTVAAVATLPVAHGFVAWLVSAAPSRVLDSLKFMLNAAAFLALRLAGGWGLVSSAGSRVSPLMRAFLAAFDQPVIQVSFAISVASCFAVLWWLRPRADRAERGMPHVGLLGF